MAIPQDNLEYAEQFEAAAAACAKAAAAYRAASVLFDTAAERATLDVARLLCATFGADGFRDVIEACLDNLDVRDDDRRVELGGGPYPMWNPLATRYAGMFEPTAVAA